MKSLLQKYSAKDWVRLGVIIVMAVVLVWSVVSLLTGNSESSWDEYRRLAETAHSGTSATIDFDTLSEENPDITAWLLSEGTGIDFPVVQGENNVYYRNHSFSGNRNSLGCLYMDSSCSAAFTERNTVIYGSGLLESLHGYTSQDYYELLPALTLYTPDGTHTVNLIAGLYTDDAADTVRTDFSSDEDFVGYIARLQSISCFTGSAYADETVRLLTLCADDEKGTFVLVGILEP